MFFRFDINLSFGLAFFLPLICSIAHRKRHASRLDSSQREGPLLVVLVVSNALSCGVRMEVLFRLPEAFTTTTGASSSSPLFRCAMRRRGGETARVETRREDHRHVVHRDHGRRRRRRGERIGRFTCDPSSSLFRTMTTTFSACRDHDGKETSVRRRVQRRGSSVL